MKNLTSVEQLNEETAKGTTVLMFSANWCPDCVVLDSDLPEIEGTFPNMTFIYVDRDQFIEVCQEMDIFGIPSFVVFQEGKEVDRYVSKDRKTKEEIVQFLQSIPKNV
ncbi:thioredoxin family protein [Texcoconibacillus texcoconensis]|uniref:Thiol-disulfide isomerase/thioredoxin n=1 Tax=Texcoconibacillus texcoconensis TaxID=1095777 RepID=A0A840QN41_9BACI|nr:thioredoxin family protein [Texcoconibacillus texcoconensis]MBB5172786.1 thiol-disulfide isomerase/thioredoxin [Texcoconibacillus texcoconensis]